MTKNYYSFDIFDTCLARLCGEPINLYDVLSQKIMETQRCQWTEHMRQIFVTLRIEAGREETNLECIYSNIAQRFPLPMSIGEMIQLELDLEREMLVPILPTLQKVNHHRKLGAILFISDMYLPSSFLQERLSALGFFKEGDKVFVSNEWDATKYDGLLYRKIHEKENIPYKQWNHYGDNYRGDYTIPKKMGIHAHLIEFKYLPYEKQWKEIPTYQYPWPSLMAGVSRAIRLQSTAPAEQSNFVCNISAPLMTSFVLNVMEDATQRRIQRLFFCARDMHSYFLIAKRFSHKFPSLEIYYTFISSQVLYENTRNTFAYFKQIGLASKDVLSAIVDTNTKGGTLPAINRMMKSHGNNNVHGYYLTGISEACASVEENSLPHYSIFFPYVKNGQQKAAKLPGMRILYELLFCLNYHKKTINYESHGNIIRPVFAKDEEDILSFKDTDIKSMKQSNDKLLLEYATALDKTLLPKFWKEILNQMALPTLLDFISFPNKTYLPYLKKFQLSEQPFVDNLYRRTHPIWKRGSIIYSIPTIFAKFCTKIARNEEHRRRVLKIIHFWK